MSASSITDPLQAAQESILFYLAGTEYLAEVPMLLLRKENLENKLYNALKVLAVTPDGRKPGACVVVLMPTADVADPNLSGPQMEVTFTIRIMENPTINLSDGGTGKSAEALALFTLRALHGLAISGQLSTLYGDNAALRPAEEKDLVAYDVQLKARLGQNPEAKCAPVALAAGAGTFTATCATAGADIYYTTDGTFPFKAPVFNLATMASLYTGATAYASGDTIRSVAYATNYLPSDIAELLT